MSEAPLVTSFEAGLILDKSARTIHRMSDRGELPMVQKLPGPNGAYLFRKTDVEALKAKLDAEKAARERVAS